MFCSNSFLNSHQPSQLLVSEKPSHFRKQGRLGKLWPACVNNLQHMCCLLAACNCLFGLFFSVFVCLLHLLHLLTSRVCLFVVVMFCLPIRASLNILENILDFHFVVRVVLSYIDIVVVAIRSNCHDTVAFGRVVMDLKLCITMYQIPTM